MKTIIVPKKYNEKKLILSKNCDNDSNITIKNVRIGFKNSNIKVKSDTGKT